MKIALRISIAILGLVFASSAMAHGRGERNGYIPFVAGAVFGYSVERLTRPYYYTPEYNTVLPYS